MVNLISFKGLLLCREPERFVFAAVDIAIGFGGALVFVPVPVSVDNAFDDSFSLIESLSLCYLL